MGLCSEQPRVSESERGPGGTGATSPNHPANADAKTNTECYTPLRGWSLRRGRGEDLILILAGILRHHNHRAYGNLRVENW